MSDLPEIVWLRQHRHGPSVADPAAATEAALTGLHLAGDVRPGSSVAVAVGSRGIADLATIVRATVDHLRALGAEPFVVPGMGSHGGGTADGQANLLAGYGVDEVAMGCPVRSSMDVIEIARSDLGFPIWFDRNAHGADHVVVVNRVKPHTVLTGEVESGLAKMLLIGLGKQQGAEAHHRAVFNHPWTDIVQDALPRLLSSVPVLAGVAVVENEADETARVDAVRGTEILAREPALLDEARRLLPRLPFDEVDVLLVDQIGKNISGSGIDTNVVGRKGPPHVPVPGSSPRVGTIVVRGLTSETDGNAMGIGLVELCRTRVAEEMDRRSTWVNAMTSGNLPAGMLPVHLDTDRELLDACTTRLGLRDLSDARLCWIRNTLDLQVVAASTSLLDTIGQRDDIELVDGPVPLPLDAAGNLPDLLPVR